MKLVPITALTEQVLTKRAIPQFNINGYLWIESLLEVMQQIEEPLILAITDRNVERLGGYSYLVDLIDLKYKQLNLNVPLVIHLDHAQSVDSCKRAIDAGFSSVMYDGSSLSLDENIQNTLEVMEYARGKNVSVEAELGAVGGEEDGIVSDVKFTSVEDCREFVRKTNVDLLAPALGSVHGEYSGEPDLQFDTMKEIFNEIKIPLVLHGASGLSTDDLHQAIEYGHAKVNFNTELNINLAQQLKQLLDVEPMVYDPKILLEKAKESLKKTMMDRIKEIYLLNK
ncbi:6-phospho-5-dehydro-2-deoxy-D-gluconate aldolase [Dolosicoccus paucivorans]|uniref:class II fructose-bisphosphate aldolase n=1 Tax=Dolosicoccus paucivorans TaxID=84521 RepID=UPI000C7FE19E|nr:class II fructose-bisphosphate aldolase [Dolosicoccus paucivorans]PMB85092.1 6-phospho-5-dehydro-2-deoxy-D-gluconate aldolase [Dolosicoccus paucivorans]